MSTASPARDRSTVAAPSRRFCVAPMMDWTDRHDRYLLRLISRHTRLYTEMVTTSALLHGDRDRLLRYDPSEQPLALQLGGSEPAALAECARLAAARGFVEINLNVGCPSDRVQEGRFGACLMREPDRVAECVAAMRQATDLEVTVKTRIGIDDDAAGPRLAGLVERVAEAGCHGFIVHARNAWLRGLSPRQNRDVPPLRYDTVYALKRDRPELEIVINGGITDLDQCRAHLQRVDGVMLGRAAYHDPYLLAGVDAELFDDPAPVPSRHQVVERYLPYVERQLAEGVRLGQVTRHMLGLFQGCPGARRWRRRLSEHSHRPGAGTEVIARALAEVAPA